MATLERNVVTSEEFSTFVNLPENRDRSFELIGGEIFPVVSNHFSSRMAMRIVSFIHLYLAQNDIGATTGADGGYIVGKDRYIPDIAFIRHDRFVDESIDGYITTAPDLVVEVISPSNTAQEMRLKVANYGAAGTVAWIVDEEAKTVEVYVPGAPAKVLRPGDTLDGGTALPGFQVAIDDIFRARQNT
jgi:Uma2 family endonuclease